MSILKIKIKNCKSIKDAYLNLNQINCVLGENGSGKTNIIKCLRYFYDNLTENKIDDSIFDKNNPFCRFSSITLTYDINKIISFAEKNSYNHILMPNNISPIFKKALDIKNEFAKSNGLIELCLKQSKDNMIKWYPNNFNLRSFLKNTFPIYFIHTRNMNLTDWEVLWQVIGELGATNDSTFAANLEKFLVDNLGDKSAKTIKHIESELKSNNVGITEFTLQEKFKQIYQIQFGGKSFAYNETVLSYFSDGMNSLRYIKLLTGLVYKLSQTNVKEPMIVMDEPEISLHPSNIDNLSDSIIKNSQRVKMLLSTHSSRIVKNILAVNNSLNLFHSSLQNSYTYIKRMDNLIDGKSSTKVSDKESSLFFSKNIVFVEGATEIELFYNNNLRNLFSILKRIEFYSYDSDNTKLKITHSKLDKTNINHLLIIDLDKILKYNKALKNFSFNNDSYVNPLVNKEIEKKEVFFYQDNKSKYRLREFTYNLRKRINGLRKNHQFISEEYWNYIEDKTFVFFKDLIKIYCLNYDIFPLDTTVEGLIINCDNHSIVYEWLRNVNQDKQLLIDEIYNFSPNDLYRATVLRLIENGKYDNLENIMDVSKISKSDIRNIYNKIVNLKESKKTSGWVSNFIDYFFEHYINRPGLLEPQKVSVFKKYFSELYLILEVLVYNWCSDELLE